MKKKILIGCFISSFLISQGQINIGPDIIICPSCFVSCSPEIIFEQKEDVVYISPLNNQIAIVGNNARDIPFAQTSGVFITNDGGNTWLENYNVSQVSGDPIVSIDNNGQFYFGGLTNRVGVFKFDQTDLSNPLLWNSQLIDADGTSDKPHLWIDNYSGSNKIYYGYSRTYATSITQVVIKRTDINNFNTWSPEVIVSNTVSGTYANVGINICTGPQGQVYAVWAIYDLPFNNTFGTKDEDGLGFAKLDAVNFQIQTASRLPINTRGTRGSGVINGSGVLDGNEIVSMPTMATNQQNGHLYIVWTNIGVPGTNTGDPDIYFIKSIDEGVTWSAPVRVNQDTPNNNKNQFYATISCDPNTGVIAVGYLDSRDNHPLRDYYVSLSNDDGQNWHDYRVSDASFDNTAGRSNDYTWVDVKNNYVIPVWNENILDPTCLVNYNNAFTSAFTIACPNDISSILCNLNENTSQFYRASNSITVAGNPTSCYYNILATGGNVAFQAGNNIKFAEGFHAENGCTMHAYINTNCNLVGSFSNGSGQRVTHTNNTSSVSNRQNNNEVKNFRVYPNPAQNKIYLTFNLQQEGQTIVTLNDVSGKEITILNKYLDNGFYKTEIDLTENNLNPGIYFLKLSTNHEVKSIKFAKLK